MSKSMLPWETAAEGARQFDPEQAAREHPDLKPGNSILSLFADMLAQRPEGEITSIEMGPHFRADLIEALRKARP